MTDDAPTPLDQRWADIHLIAAAAARHIKNVAYISTGGTAGCALCKDRSTKERVEAGHVTCAEEGVTFKAAMRVAAEAAQFDMDIAISRAFDDPRLFQWVTVPAGDTR